MNEPVRMGEQPEAPLRITIERVESADVVRLAGDLDLLTAPLLRDQLWPLLERPGGLTLVDLNELSFLGSAGLSELAAANDTALRNGVRLVLVATSRTVLRPLEVTGLHTLFPIFESVDAAFSAL